jgi:hypothetical protein
VPPRPAELVGAWVSDVRQTDRGPMEFEFRWTEEGRLEVTGTSESGALDAEYRRSGPYQLEGILLISSALNEGEPVRIGRDGDGLLLKIDDTLQFRLRRR